MTVTKNGCTLSCLASSGYRGERQLCVSVSKPDWSIFAVVKPRTIDHCSSFWFSFLFFLVDANGMQ